MDIKEKRRTNIAIVYAIIVICTTMLSVAKSFGGAATAEANEIEGLVDCDGDYEQKQNESHRMIVGEITLETARSDQQAHLMWSDCPLDVNAQEWLCFYAKMYDINPSRLLAMIELKSGFNSTRRGICISSPSYFSSKTGQYETNWEYGLLGITSSQIEAYNYLRQGFGDYVEMRGDEDYYNHVLNIEVGAWAYNYNIMTMKDYEQTQFDQYFRHWSNLYIGETEDGR